MIEKRWHSLFSSYGDQTLAYLRTIETDSLAAYTQANPVIAASSIRPARNHPCRTNNQTSVGETTVMKS